MRGSNTAKQTSIRQVSLVSLFPLDYLDHLLNLPQLTATASSIFKLEAGSVFDFVFDLTGEGILTTGESRRALSRLCTHSTYSMPRRVTGQRPARANNEASRPAGE